MRRDPLLPRPLGRPDLLSLSTVRARYPRDRNGERAGRGSGRIVWVLLLLAAAAGFALGEWWRP